MPVFILIKKQKIFSKSFAETRCIASLYYFLKFIFGFLTTDKHEYTQIIDHSFNLICVYLWFH